MEANSLTFFQNDLRLRQSELFGDDYKNIEAQTIYTYNELTISNIEDWKNSILKKYSFLNSSQVNNLELFFFSLSKILETINPEKLQINDDCINEENEVLLWRESARGISKLSFNEYGQLTYMFVGNEGKKTRGTFENNVDFEKLIYRFLSL